MLLLLLLLLVVQVNLLVQQAVHHFTEFQNTMKVGKNWQQFEELQKLQLIICC